MAYLIAADFKKLIQTDNLNQIIGGDTTILTAIQQAAQSEAVSYLAQKYITAQEFTSTNVWSNTTVYQARNRVYLDASSYDSTKAYTSGQLALYNGIVYISTAVTTGAFDTTKWTAINAQGTIYFVTLPFPEFNYNLYYKIGSVVYWQGSVYTAKVATRVNNHSAALQSGDRRTAINIFPDDPISGVTAWDVGVAYNITVGSLPTDITKWTLGDNRNPQLVNYCIDIALYHLHSRIAPRNIPELRVVRHDQAIQWLKDSGQGKITADLPLIQPKQGGRIRYGSEIKRINSF